MGDSNLVVLFLVSYCLLLITTNSHLFGRWGRGAGMTNVGDRQSRKTKQTEPTRLTDRVDRQSRHTEQTEQTDRKDRQTYHTEQKTEQTFIAERQSRQSRKTEQREETDRENRQSRQTDILSRQTDKPEKRADFQVLKASPNLQQNGLNPHGKFFLIIFLQQ
jgi:hypothetical protein